MMRQPTTWVSTLSSVTTNKSVMVLEIPTLCVLNMFFFLLVLELLEGSQGFLNFL